MMRIEPTPARSKLAEELASSLRAGARAAFRAPVPQAVVAGVLRQVPEALHVYVPVAADQSERIILALAESSERPILREVDGHLVSKPEQALPALRVVQEALGARPILVEGWDRLGHAGIDRELGLALGARNHELREWLADRASLFVATRGDAPVKQRLVDPRERPFDLVNGEVRETGLWEALQHDPEAYGLALAALALAGEDARGDESDLATMSSDELRREVVDRLPPSARQLLTRLALHGRPFPRSAVPNDITPTSARIGSDLALWNAVGDCLVVADGWTDWFQRFLAPEVRRSIHLELALAWARDVRPADPAAAQAALALLEAHRHFVAAGDLARAREFARYGAAQLVEAARERSMAGDYPVAARIYEMVVAMDGEHSPLPRRLRGYARHYLHFNRAHARPALEGPASTEAGYRGALEDWRENGLFWSRLVRAVFYQERPAAALELLAEARAAVPPHPLKESILVARTASRLLANERTLDAVLVWADHVPTTPLDVEVEEQLIRRLCTGWTSSHLALPGIEALWFTRPADVRVVRGGTRWTAELRTVPTRASGQSPLDALQALVRQVRAETSRLVVTYTSDLSPTERLRKQVVLGLVDVAASRLDAVHLDAYWVYGTLEREGDTIWLRTGGDRDVRFEVPASIADGAVDAWPHLARVAADERTGEPRGPVLELEPAFRGTEEDLWRAWRRRFSDAG